MKNILTWFVFWSNKKSIIKHIDLIDGLISYTYWLIDWLTDWLIYST